MASSRRMTDAEYDARNREIYERYLKYSHDAGKAGTFVAFARQIGPEYGLKRLRIRQIIADGELRQDERQTTRKNVLASLPPTNYRDVRYWVGLAGMVAMIVGAAVLFAKTL